MATRTVRLDDEEERILARIRRRTGLSVSEVLKLGVREAAAGLEREARRARDVYENLDLGPGGYALAPARTAKRAVRDLIRRKHGR